MANALGMDIENKFVLLRKDWFASSTLAEDIRERVFLAQGGFGCQDYTMGNAVVGEFVVDGEECRVEGYQLESRLATPDEIERALNERARRGIDIDDRMQAVLDEMAGA